MAARDNLAGADIGSIYGLLGMARGVGNVICGPLSDVLLKDGKSGMGRYGGGFGPIIVFTGITAAAAVGSTSVRWIGRLIR